MKAFHTHWRVATVATHTGEMRVIGLSRDTDDDEEEEEGDSFLSGQYTTISTWQNSYFLILLLLYNSTNTAKHVHPHNSVKCTLVNSSLNRALLL